MDKFFHKHSLYIAVILFIFSVILFNNQVFAFGRPATFAGQNHENLRPTDALSPEPDATSSGARGEGDSHMSAFAKGQLQGGKLQACQRIEKTLTTRSTHLVSLVTNMEKVFTSIAQGVEQYYLTKVVPTGASLASYDSLVADIATKQNALTPLVAAAQNDATTFSCTGTNPGASMTQYRTDMQAVIQALKEYRTAIKNLIVAVRTLPSINPTAEPSESPKPSVTPTPTVAATPTETPTPTIAPSVTP